MLVVEGLVVVEGQSVFDDEVVLIVGEKQCELSVFVFCGEMFCWYVVGEVFLEVFGGDEFGWVVVWVFDVVLCDQIDLYVEWCCFEVGGFDEVDLGGVCCVVC